MPTPSVFVVMRRTDIPASLLQFTELKPNNSQRNYIYEGEGQTQYQKPIPGSDAVATAVDGTDVLVAGDARGLAAYLIDRVADGDDGGVGDPQAAITAAEANAAATAILALAQAGSPVTEDAVDAALVAAGAHADTSLSTAPSTGELEDVLGILAGRVYLVPGGSRVQDDGVFDPTVSGSFVNDAEYKQMLQTGAFNISNGIGQISKFKSADFTYLGEAGPAITVYAADGTLL